MDGWMDGWENIKTGSRSRRRRQDSCQNCLVYFGINLFMMTMVMVVSLPACLPSGVLCEREEAQLDGWEIRNETHEIKVEHSAILSKR